MSERQDSERAGREARRAGRPGAAADRRPAHRSATSPRRELQAALGMPSNLLAHHLNVLEARGHDRPAPLRGATAAAATSTSIPGALDRLSPDGVAAARPGACSSAPRTPPAPSSPPRSGRSASSIPVASGRHAPGRRGSTPARSRPRNATTSPCPTADPAALADVLGDAGSRRHGLRQRPRGTRRRRRAALVDPRPGARSAPTPRSTPPPRDSQRRIEDLAPRLAAS